MADVELSTNVGQAGTVPTSTSSPQSDVWEGPIDTPEYQAWLKAHTKTPPVPGKVGPKCQYCENKDKIQKLADEYVNKHRIRSQGEKATIPFIEELADILDVDDETIDRWAARKLPESEEFEHPEFHQTFGRLKNIQKLRLLQRTLGRYNPTGAIFQLKVNHGAVETEKKIITGDSNAPLLIELVPEKPTPEQDE